MVSGKFDWGRTRGKVSFGALVRPMARTRMSSARLWRTGDSPKRGVSAVMMVFSLAGPVSRDWRTASEGSSRWKTAAEGTR